MRFYKLESKVKIFPFQNKLYKDVTINWLLHNHRDYALDDEINASFSIKSKQNLNLFLTEDDHATSLAYWLGEKGFDTRVINFTLRDMPSYIKEEIKNDYIKVITNSDGYFLLHLHPEICGYINNIYELNEISSVEPLVAELESKIADVVDIPFQQLIYSSIRNSFAVYNKINSFYKEISNFHEQYYKRAFINPYTLR